MFWQRPDAIDYGWIATCELCGTEFASSRLLPTEPVAEALIPEPIRSEQAIERAHACRAWLDKLYAHAQDHVPKD